MIDIRDIEVVGLRHAIMSMRNPMNSWEESDSKFEDGQFIIGEKDLALAMKLVKAGTDHSKFMRDIQIKCQISAPLYWWKEMDTYKVATVRNSCSTMHKILDHEFTIDDFSVDKIGTDSYSYNTIKGIIDNLNKLRTICIGINDSENACYKDAWYQIIQLLPSSYIQTSSWSGSYQTLRNIWFARKNHKLDEWHEFCHMIEGLPYAELITCLSAKDELIAKLKAENEGLKNELKVVDYCRNDVAITASFETLSIVADELESKDRKIKDLFDEKNVLNKRIDELEAENQELKKKLENANAVDEIIIDKTRNLLDMLKTKPKKGVMIFDMNKVSDFCVSEEIAINEIKHEYSFQTDTSPIILDGEDIKKILEQRRRVFGLSFNGSHIVYGATDSPSDKESINELKAENERLKTENDKLKKKIDRTKGRLNSIYGTTLLNKDINKILEIEATDKFIDELKAENQELKCLIAKILRKCSELGIKINITMI